MTLLMPYGTGSTNHVLAPVVDTKQIGNISMFCWINASGSLGRGTFMKNGSKYGISFGIGSYQLDTSGNQLLGLYESIRWVRTGIVIPDGWHHMGIMVNSAGMPFFVMDGVNLGSVPGTVPGIPDTFSYIGGTYVSNRNFTGQIRDARFYNGMLGSADIKNLYNSGSVMLARDLGCGYAN
jgi:hypothetical protein